MLAVALLPALLFGLFALVPMLDTSSDDDLEDDGTFEGLGVANAVTVEDPEGEDPVGGEDPDAVDPDGEDPDEVDPTVVSITGEDGVTLDVEVTPNEDGSPVDVDGSEQGDVIESPNETTTPLQLNGFGGDDTIGFGYSTSVDPGADNDELALTITQAALDNGDLEAGIVTFDDSADVLAIDIEDGAEGFLHEVRINSSDTVDESTTTETATLFYVLSANEELSIDAAASAAAGEVVFEDGAQVLVQIDLGTETTTTGTDEAGEPTQEVTGAINEDPAIAINRDVTSEQTLDIPAQDGDGEEDEDPVVVPAVTISTDGGEETELALENGNEANGTDDDDVIVATDASPADLDVDAGDGDDMVTLQYPQDVNLTGGAADIEDGQDSVTYVVGSESVTDAIVANEAATAFNEFADSASIQMGPADSLTFEIDPEIEGRLIRVDYSTFFLSNEESSAFDSAAFLIVPDDVDVQAAIDANENGAPDNDLSFLLENFGAVLVGTVDLGGSAEFFGETNDDQEDFDTRFDLTQVFANRDIEAFEYENTAP